jgi:membrane protease YdiL (CAAX protease family)
VSIFREFLFEFLAWLTVAGVCAAIVIPIWLSRREEGFRLFPPRHHNPVSWTGWEILAVFFLAYFLWPSLVGFCLDRSGFFSWLYGGPESSAHDLEEIAKEQHNLWIIFFAFPLNLATVLVLFRLSSGTPPYQLGLSFYSPAKHLALACLTWLIMTPLVFGVNFLASLAYFDLTGQKPEHPLQELAESSPLITDAILIGLIALVIAPIWEELLFRGVVQSWLAQQEWRSHLAMGLAFFIAISTGITDLYVSRELNLGSILGDLSPMLFVTILIGAYLFTDRLVRRWIPDRSVFRGIFATSSLFAMVHSPVWPTPIPLFFLALGLGYLAYRTQSLLASIIFHSLFNAVACIALLFLQLGTEAKNGSEATSAGTRPASTATSTRVPAVWQLR